MTLAGFVRKNAFRNWRRTLLTIGSMAFSLLLLSFLMSIWRAFYSNDLRSEQSEMRLIVRHKVSLTNLLPISYRDKMRQVPGVTHVVPFNWFNGVYKDSKPENFFARFGVDPTEFFDVYTELSIPQDQKEAWIKDRAGCVADKALAQKYGWKVGDRIVIQGDIYPIRLELTLRGIFTSKVSNNSLYFNWKYVEEGVSWAKDHAGLFGVMVDSPQDVPKVAKGIDDVFANAPEPTKTETEKQFGLDFIAQLGNVKAFILIIALASVFTMLLVSGNTMAMSIRERIREVAVLKTLGFRRETILGVFIGEAASVAFLGGIVGTLISALVLGAVSAIASKMSPQVGQLAALAFHELTFTIPASWTVAILAGLLSSAIPAYFASRTPIVEGLRHIG